MDARLRQRYARLVQSHMNVTSSLSAGAKALLDGRGAFAHTQAMWRFLRNEQIDLAKLSEPVLALARDEVPAACDDYALAIHDWSRLNFRRHTRKHDTVQMTHKTDVGYELQSTVLASDRDGQPITAPAQNLVTADGVWQTRQTGLQEPSPHLDELSQRMSWLEAQGLGRPLVHIVDREADSVAHMRHWSAQGQHWLIRSKGGSRLCWEGRSSTAARIAQALSYTDTRTVQYHGRPALQRVGEAAVVLTRNAKPKKTDAHGKRVAEIPGAALSVRLVVSRVYVQGTLVAEWFLLSNLPPTVPAERIALWYYFRWEIESFFKVLKQAGMQLESWGQESGPALAKRILIATQACALAWRLMRQTTPEAHEAQTFLVRLSGRQMKRSRPVTLTALLDGTFQLLTMLEALEHYSLDRLKQFAHSLLRSARE